MSKLKYTVSDETALREVEKAFRRGTYPAAPLDIATRLTRLAESRRGDRFETIGDVNVSRPILKVIVQILENEVAPDKLKLFVRNFEELFGKLPQPMPDETWETRRRQRAPRNYGDSLGLADPVDSKEDQPQAVSLKSQYEALEEWLTYRVENRSWDEVAPWTRIIVKQLKNNILIPKNIQGIIEKPDPTADDLTAVRNYLDEAYHNE